MKYERMLGFSQSVELSSTFPEYLRRCSLWVDIFLALIPKEDKAQAIEYMDALLTDCRNDNEDLSAYLANILLQLQTTKNKNFLPFLQVHLAEFEESCSYLIGDRYELESMIHNGKKEDRHQSSLNILKNYLNKTLIMR